MRGWFEKIRAGWLLVVGIALLYFGLSGAPETVRQLRAYITGSDPAYLSNQGFVPYVVPLGKNAGSAPDLGHSRMKPTQMSLSPGQVAAHAAQGTATATPEGWVETPVPVLLPANVENDNNLFKTPLPSPTPTFTPTPEPTLPPEQPSRIVINSISLDAEVVPAVSKKVTIDGIEFEQWLAPDRKAAGWQTDSAFLGQIGNTVLNGHHNINGMVFRYLVDINAGDIISVYGSTQVYHYVVTNKMILPEKYVSLEQRMENARWIMHSDDQRLTLVTCWPFESNTHRLIVVAQPVDQQSIAQTGQ